MNAGAKLPALFAPFLDSCAHECNYSFTDKKRFVEKYANLVFNCKNDDRVIRRVDLCNGVSECGYGSDEKNCSKCKELNLYVSLYVF